MQKLSFSQAFQRLFKNNLLTSLLWICLVMCCLPAFLKGVEDKKTLCLNMIVKDEKDVIVRCLESVKPIIDYWVIVDTGSTDGTQDIIRQFMKDVPGELHERPWKNFAHNRTEALKLAANKGDYLLFIDADETFSYEPNFKLPNLEKDFYFIQTNFNETKYARALVINNQLDWKWVGVLHEALQATPNTSSCEILPGITNIVRTDGARSKDPLKYQKDAAVLEQALLEEPNNVRYAFYLAQTYKDAEMNEKAIAAYKKRIAMGGWDEEIFWSMLQIGLIQEAQKADPKTIATSYLQAYLYRPTRIEPLYRLAQYYRLSENYQKGYEVAAQGLPIRDSQDLLFVEKWIYDWGLLLEYSICAYWIEKYDEALLASYAMLAQSNLPQNVRDCVNRNLIWINGKIKENHSQIHLIKSILSLEKAKEELITSSPNT
jgi:glycosyltransferase involved in cell wall biosynthesis